MSYSWGVGATPAVATGPSSVSPIGAGRSGSEVTRNVGQETPPSGGDLHLLAAELAPMVDVWTRLLAQHVPDRSGRCRTCTKGGTGLPSTSWPCSIQGIADLARRSHAGEFRTRAG